MSAARVLVVTADETLLDDTLRLVAAAGCEADVSRDVAGSRARWRAAAAVLLGADRLAAAARVALPRREGVLLVGREPLEAAGWERAVEVGAAHVLVLPDGEARLVELVGAAVRRPERPGVSIAVLGGSGGAGASVLAVALAVTAARRGDRVLLVDGDPIGGGLDLLLGVEGTPGLRWPDLPGVVGAGGYPAGPAADVLRPALPVGHGVAVLSHRGSGTTEPDGDSVSWVVESSRRAGDTVIVDLSRHCGPVSLAVSAAADSVLLVVPARLRAVVAASQVVARSGGVGAVGLVVRTPPRAPLPASAVADSVGVPLLAVLRDEPGLVAAIERGEPPGSRGRGPLASVCTGLLPVVTGESRRARRRAGVR